MTLSEQLIDEIDRRIARLMPETGGASPLYGMMKYHLGWLDEALRPARADAGKRIRARLCLLACQAVGSPPEVALPAATAVELIHNFSLIHDDIQDRSEYRRHRRTVWAVWGEAQAINAGDAMLATAQLALMESDALDPSRAVQALRQLNRASQLLCEGQYLDLEYERRSTITVEDYLAMIERKTGALLETSCFLGALYGSAEETRLEAFSRFGRQLGLAFQMQDDYLGIWGDPRITGKPAAGDVASKKKSLPLVYALAQSSSNDRSELERILGRPGPAETGEVAQVLAILNRCGAAEYTVEQVAKATAAALEALASAKPEPGAGAELEALCRQLVGRAK